MHLFFFILGLWSSSPQPQTRIAYLDLSSQSLENFEVLTEKLKPCNHCKAIQLTPFEGKQVQRSKIPQLLNRLSDFDILYVGFNEPRKAEHRELIEVLSQISRSGKLIVAKAGFVSEELKSAPLKESFIVEVPDVIILGQRTNRDVLLDRSFFGPEMLTALKEPLESFVLQVALRYSKKSKEEWVGHFKGLRSSSKKLWLDNFDFFKGIKASGTIEASRASY